MAKRKPEEVRWAEWQAARKPDALDTEIGQRIRAVRLSREVTQQQLGTAIGVSYQMVQKYELATSRVSASTLYEICIYLDCSIQDLFPSRRRGTKRQR